MGSALPPEFGRLSPRDLPPLVVFLLLLCAGCVGALSWVNHVR